MRLTRYLSAFTRALILTLRGEQVAIQRHPQIAAWAQETARLVTHAIDSADRTGLRMEQRRRLVQHIDKRDISLETALQTIRHHAVEEYPFLLRHYTSYTMLTIHATNLNDQYLAVRFAEHEDLDAELRSALSRLHHHLQAFADLEKDDHPDGER